MFFPILIQSSKMQVELATDYQSINFAKAETPRWINWADIVFVDLTSGKISSKWLDKFIEKNEKLRWCLK